MTFKLHYSSQICLFFILKAFKTNDANLLKKYKGRKEIRIIQDFNVLHSFNDLNDKNLSLTAEREFVHFLEFWLDDDPNF